MSENLNSNNFDNDAFNLKNTDSDYRDLINRLQEIKLTIALLEKKKWLNKFYILDKNKSK